MFSCWSVFISSIMRSWLYILSLVAILSSCGCSSFHNERPPVKTGEYYYSVDGVEGLRSFFSLSTGDIIISGHRGGSMTLYPENCLETMDRILHSMTTFFEIDPRLTADSVAVLLHDETLDRTTTGTGLLRETLSKDLEGVFLKDASGQVTSYHLSRLDDVLAWSRDKVILHIDQKEIPFTVMWDLVCRMDLHNIVFSAQVCGTARYMVDVAPTVQILAWMGSMEDFEAYEQAGVLDNIVAVWVRRSFLDEDCAQLCKALRDKGIRVMVATAAERQLLGTALESGPDIIETDFPTAMIGRPNVRK